LGKENFKRSLRYPFLSLATPLSWSARPSALFSLFPVRELEVSLTHPLVLSAAPATLSRSLPLLRMLKASLARPSFRELATSSIRFVAPSISSSAHFLSSLVREPTPSLRKPHTCPLPLRPHHAYCPADPFSSSPPLIISLVAS
jgi:hypothetical protein